MRVVIVSHATGPEGIQYLLDAVTAMNCDLLRRSDAIPRLYDAGVSYGREPRGCADTVCGEERFATIPEVLRARVGDCDDLAPWRAAELTVRDGIPSRAVVVRSGRRKYHVLVHRSDGVVEDPSRVLGMGWDEHPQTVQTVRGE